MKQERLSYAFFGSGFFAARCLEHLSAWIAPAWIVTAPARPAGRGKRETPTLVDALAATLPTLHGIPILRTATASTDEGVLRLLREIPVDFNFVIDFGQRIAEPVLRWSEPVGCLNVHPSLLPRYRGAAPVQRCLLDGAERTGVTIFKLAAAMDAGPILTSVELAVGPEDDTGSLLTRAALAGSHTFVDYSLRTPYEEWVFTPQDESLATGAPKIAAAEERIDWNRGTRETFNRIRALSPKPGAWTTFSDRRLRILSSRTIPTDADDLSPGGLVSLPRGVAVCTGDGLLELLSVQAEGKKVQPADQWWNGVRRLDGACLI